MFPFTPQRYSASSQHFLFTPSNFLLFLLLSLFPNLKSSLAFLPFELHRNILVFLLQPPECSFQPKLSLSSLSTINLRPLGLFIPPRNHLPISFMVFLYFSSLQVCNLKFFGVVCCHPFFVYVPSNLYYIALIFR